MSEQKPDGLAAELVPDPTKLPDLVVLRGFLGNSTRAGYSRLYVDVTFSAFVEVADEDVLARRSLEELSWVAQCCGSSGMRRFCVRRSAWHRNTRPF